MSEINKDIFDPLLEVREVEAPAFLLTRIHQAIQQQKEEQAWVVKRTWVISACFMVVMLMNVWLILHVNQARHTDKLDSSSNTTALYSFNNDNNLYQ